MRCTHSAALVCTVALTHFLLLVQTASFLVDKNKLGGVFLRCFRRQCCHLSVHGSWATVGWGAVDDAVWEQFAGRLGDASLQNISLLASTQPADIQEAIMATSTGAVGRTKLRLARFKFRLNQSLWVHHRQQFQSRSQLGQLSVIYSLVQAGITPYADFGVWRPLGQRAAKSLKFVAHFLDNTVSWRCKEIPGPDSTVLGGVLAGLPHRGDHVRSGRQQCWTVRRRRFVHAWNVSTTVGICACWIFF